MTCRVSLQPGPFPPASFSGFVSGSRVEFYRSKTEASELAAGLSKLHACRLSVKSGESERTRTDTFESLLSPQVKPD